jgi:putative endonuclease
MAWLDTIRERWGQWRREVPLGRRGERAAAKYLRRLGYVIVAQGQRDHVGELDLVAVDQRTIVFVEVKTRQSDDVLAAVEAVDEQKQRRITRTALAFLRRHDLLEERCRFDVVAVCWPPGQRRPAIRHFPDAFPAIGQWQLFR